MTAIVHGLSHAAIKTADLAATVHFYCDILQNMSDAFRYRAGESFFEAMR
jgi:extradiol dioxygenase family protein